MSSNLIDADGKARRCECERDDHFTYGSDAHRYASAPLASVVIQTSRGAYAVCALCAEEHSDPDYAEESEPAYDPDSGDYAISDIGSLTERVGVSQYGRQLFTCPDVSADALIREHAQRAAFYPDVWRISDHGNAHIIEAFWTNSESDPARVVFVGGYGWRDCDTLASIAGFDRAAVEKRIADDIAEERERANDSWEPDICESCDPDDCACADCDCDDPDLDDLCDYGVSVFTLAEAIRDTLTTEELSELLTDGIVSCSQ